MSYLTLDCIGVIEMIILLKLMIHTHWSFLSFNCISDSKNEYRFFPWLFNFCSYIIWYNIIFSPYRLIPTLLSGLKFYYFITFRIISILLVILITGICPLPLVLLAGKNVPFISSICVLYLKIRWKYWRDDLMAKLSVDTVLARHYVVDKICLYKYPSAAFP